MKKCPLGGKNLEVFHFLVHIVNLNMFRMLKFYIFDVESIDEITRYLGVFLFVSFLN